MEQWVDGSTDWYVIEHLDGRLEFHGSDEQRQRWEVLMQDDPRVRPQVPRGEEAS